MGFMSLLHTFHTPNCEHFYFVPSLVLEDEENIEQNKGLRGGKIKILKIQFRPLNFYWSSFYIYKRKKSLTLYLLNHAKEDSLKVEEAYCSRYRN